MPKRFHLNQPDHAKALADALATCQDISDQQRLLAAMRHGGQRPAYRRAQIAGKQLGIVNSRRQFFQLGQRAPRKEGSKDY